MQMVLVPLYDKHMVVQVYLFCYQTGNNLFSTTQATNVFDGGSRSMALEAINRVGLEALTLNKPIVVPINYIMLLGNLAVQCNCPPEKVLFLLEEVPPPEEPYLTKMKILAEKGFRFAVSDPKQPQEPNQVIEKASLCFRSQQDEKKMQHAQRVVQLMEKLYPHIQWVATHVYSEDCLNQMIKKDYSLFESRFNRVPITKGVSGLSPLKANSLRLINTVQDEQFEFSEVSKIVQADPSLTISMLKLVNTPLYRLHSQIRTIGQAVSLLVQTEVGRRVPTARTPSLESDRPNELPII